MSKKEKSSRPSKVPQGFTSYDSVDGVWKEIGFAPPARHALVDAKLLTVSDLRKVSLDKLKAIPGIGPNEVRILVSEMKKRDISFRNSK